MTLTSANRCIPDGFAWRAADGLLVYGVAPQGTVTAIGLEPPGDGSGLARLAQKHELLLVDWCAARLVDPGGLQGYQPGYRSLRRSRF